MTTCSDDYIVTHSSCTASQLYSYRKLGTRPALALSVPRRMLYNIVQMFLRSAPRSSSVSRSVSFSVSDFTCRIACRLPLVGNVRLPTSLLRLTDFIDFTSDFTDFTSDFPTHRLQHAAPPPTSPPTSPASSSSSTTARAWAWAWALARSFFMPGLGTRFDSGEG
eukprot:GHVR01010896.1.p1 GENE.GHVR01010896.1~~GHVR01010896.1.p1  ORF type:complete len:165 (+),score=9.19 GHVR01010896.1:283-777(+)